MATLYCTGCRTLLDEDFLRRDGDAYVWCERCQPTLWMPAKASRKPVRERK